MKRSVCLLLGVVMIAVGYAQSKSQSQQIRVACVGNSITFGAGIHNRDKDSYPALLGQMLGREYDVRNFGVSGRTMLSCGDYPYVNEEAYRRARDFAPDIVVIKLGTNDSKPQNWQYADKFAEDAETLVGSFASLPSKPRILLCYPAKAYNVKGGINDSIIRNGVIPMIDLVVRRTGAETLDIYASTSGMEQSFPDRIHPNADGALAIANVVYKAITGCDSNHAIQPFPGFRSGFRGYVKYDFTFNGRAATVVVPKEERAGKPWIWRPAFFGAFPSVDLALLDKGYHVVYYDVTFLFGSPRSMELGDRFYDAMLKYYGFASKVVLEGFSRGGLFAVNWAARNPGKVASIYLDAPVCDVFSWPGRKRESLWNEMLQEWELTEKDMDFFAGNPLDNLAPIAGAGVHIIGVSGDSDRTVPYEENLAELARRYKLLGGHIEMIIKPEGDHHPHSLENPDPIVGFIISNSGR